MIFVNDSQIRRYCKSPITVVHLMASWEVLVKGDCKPNANAYDRFDKPNSPSYHVLNG